LSYRIKPLPRHRLSVLDLLDSTRFAARFTVHGLIEADVTDHVLGIIRRPPRCITPTWVHARASRRCTR